MKNAKKANEFNSEYRNLLMKYDIDQTEAMVLDTEDLHSEAQFGFSITGDDE